MTEPLVVWPILRDTFTEPSRTVPESESKLVASTAAIEQHIFLLRGRKVMLDRHLAALYDVETRAPTADEIEDWKSQIVISNRERMGVRKPPLAFTEYGVAMLSSVLTSERAVQVNIAIMRVFGRLRSMLLTQVELARRLDDLEARYDQQFAVVFDAIRELVAPPPDEPARRIGVGVDASLRDALTAKPAT
jgi:hypothetical protein